MNQLILMIMPKKIILVLVGLSVILNYYTGITPKQYILKKEYIMQRHYFQNTQYNINEIAQIIGYDNPLYFSRVFQKTKGISPSEYRKNISQRVFNSSL